MAEEKLEDSGERDLAIQLCHERFVQHKAQYREWATSVERRLQSIAALQRWALITLAGTLGSLVLQMLLGR